MGASSSTAAGIQAHIALMIGLAFLGAGVALRLGTRRPALVEQGAPARANQAS